MILRIVLVAAIFAVVGILYTEVRGWISGAKSVTRFQKALRITSATIMLIVLGMILAGDQWLGPYGPIAIMAYWMTSFVLAAMLIIVALFDIREVGLNYGEQRRQMLRNLIRQTQQDENDD